MGALKLDHEVESQIDVPEEHTWRGTLLPPPPTPTAQSAVMRAARKAPVSEPLCDNRGVLVNMELDWNDCLDDFGARSSASMHERQTVPRDPHPSRPTLPSHR